MLPPLMVLNKGFGKHHNSLNILALNEPHASVLSPELAFIPVNLCWYSLRTGACDFF